MQRALPHTKPTCIVRMADVCTRNCHLSLRLPTQDFSKTRLDFREESLDFREESLDFREERLDFEYIKCQKNQIQGRI